ncbi:hypothetical protein [Aquisphaera insulae]|uniref:hypothetical protein n=1 Tax=Aquisphaera insulae TaxID=2712864 RepID=UPI0013ECAB8E|nr:hypothetical protein [Aquisphaera insulae]
MGTERTPEPEPLGDRLLDQWEPPSGTYLSYRKEIETMLATQEKALLRERRMTRAIWIYIVLLTTVLLTGSGLLMFHKVEGTYVAVTAVFWFLFGAVFLFLHQINQSRFEVIKEIKGVELRLAALEETLAGRGEGRGSPGA